MYKTLFFLQNRASSYLKLTPGSKEKGMADVLKVVRESSYLFNSDYSMFRLEPLYPVILRWLFVAFFPTWRPISCGRIA